MVALRIALNSVAQLVNTLTPPRSLSNVLLVLQTAALVTLESLVELAPLDPSKTLMDYVPHVPALTRATPTRTALLDPLPTFAALVLAIALPALVLPPAPVALTKLSPLVLALAPRFLALLVAAFVIAPPLVKPAAKDTSSLVPLVPLAAMEDLRTTLVVLDFTKMVPLALVSPHQTLKLVPLAPPTVYLAPGLLATSVLLAT